MENSSETGKIIGALLLGAVVGGALGILFAPDKGSRTRRKILSKGEDLTDALTDKFDEFLENVKKDLEKVKEKTSEYMYENKPKTASSKLS